MSRRASYHLDARFLVEPSNLLQVRGACSPSGKFVWVDTRTRLRVHTLKGVPGKHVDVLLPECDPAPVAVCEIGRKAGCYDGAVRWRRCSA